MRTLLLSAALAGLLGSSILAADAVRTPAECDCVETHGSDHCCARCGRTSPCEKYCQIVCETKDIKKTVWVVQCEEFCTTLPRLAHRDGCEGEDCQACKTKGCSHDPYDPCAAENAKKFVTPKCGKVREKKTLQKKEIVCKVPSYKCVVTYCCPKCSSGPETSAPATLARPTAPMPAPKPPKAT
ncbi:MAG: hypothetical protein LLF97_09295 [Planctomycetaceae bacterium]|nr:hypothetical protein [Planctomycetaceae bacterium]